MSTKTTLYSDWCSDPPLWATARATGTPLWIRGPRHTAFGKERDIQKCLYRHEAIDLQTYGLVAGSLPVSRLIASLVVLRSFLAASNDLARI